MAASFALHSACWRSSVFRSGHTNFLVIHSSRLCFLVPTMHSLHFHTRNRPCLLSRSRGYACDIDWPGGGGTTGPTTLRCLRVSTVKNRLRGWNALPSSVLVFTTVRGRGALSRLAGAGHRGESEGEWRRCWGFAWLRRGAAVKMRGEAKTEFDRIQDFCRSRDVDRARGDWGNERNCPGDPPVRGEGRLTSCRTPFEPFSLPSRSLSAESVKYTTSQEAYSEQPYSLGRYSMHRFRDDFVCPLCPSARFSSPAGLRTHVVRRSDHKSTLLPGYSRLELEI